MWILILLLISIAFAFVVAKYIDQRRWNRYQIDRDVYFRKHPYELMLKGEFAIPVAMNKSTQFKLLNELMLRSNDQPIVQKALIQRMPPQAHHRFIVKVTIQEVVTGYLDKVYAEKFCRSLEDTDFFIGRPMTLLAEIKLIELKPNVQGCRVRLDLPTDPLMVKNLYVEPKKGQSVFS